MGRVISVIAGFLICALGLSAMLFAQIPEKAQWEITFAQVEASAGLTDMRTMGPETFEARLMDRPWSAVTPLPFVRLVRREGTVRAQLFVFWTPKALSEFHRPKGEDIVCRDQVCVRPVELSEQRDWEEVITSLAYQDACPRPPLAYGPRPVCADCPELWIKTAVDGSYREQACNMPDAGTTARGLLDLMKKAAKAAGS